jgi:UDP-N-acetylmuramoyl-L-alanyl-D-glutamate--2,6-diaminopimelate ligase
MKFSELMKRVAVRGVQVVEMRGGAHGADPEITGVAEDSRKVKPGDLFVARGGTKTSGEKFVEEALARGAVAMVLPVENPGHGHEAFYRVAVARVKDVNLACALLAHEVAGNPTAGMKVIGITGTKGKTTVAYLLRSVLKAAGHKVGMIGTVEIDDGDVAAPADMTTPGSVELAALFARMKANGVTHCVMEVSSHALHQHRVAGVDFAVGIFTNLTGDHLDYHKTMEEYAAAKAMMFEGLSEGAMAVVNVDDAWAERMKPGRGVTVMEYGVRDTLNVKRLPSEDLWRWRARIAEMSSGQMTLEIDDADAFRTMLRTPLVGKHNAYNLLATMIAARACGVNAATIVQVLSAATGAPGRLQRVAADGVGAPFQVFVDYAHTHDALENVLKALRATMGSGKLICVFGCGGDRDRTKRPKMGAIAERLADRVIVTSDNPRTEEPGAIIEEICAGFSAGWHDGEKIVVEPDRRAAIRAAIEMAGDGDVVLIAGKGHENYQIIGTTKQHFDDVEEAAAALGERFRMVANGVQRS